jgi:hypothetical protein
MINPRLVEVLSPSIFNREPEKRHEILFAYDNNAEAQLATEAALPSGKGANKGSHHSSPKRVKKCGKKQKQGPTTEEVEDALVGGFAADGMDEEASILKCILEDKSIFLFNGDSKSIIQLEQFPSETSETGSLFKNYSNDDTILFSCDNNAEAQLATEAALPSGKCANKGSHHSSPKRVKNYSKKQKQGPTAEKVENALLGGFPADEMDEEASVSKCMLEDKSIFKFNGQLKKFPFGTSETGSLFKNYSNDDKILFSCDNNAEAQLATEAALPSGKCANKGSHHSSPKRVKKYGKKQKQGPTAEKVENALLGGFPADKMDEEASVSKCMLEDKSIFKFNADLKSISHLEKFPFETSQTGSLFKDYSNDDRISFSCDNNAEAQLPTEAASPLGKGSNKGSSHSSPKRRKKYSKKQKQGPIAEKVEDALLGDLPADDMDEEASILKCLLEDNSHLAFDYDPEMISQIEKFLFETCETESLFKDDTGNGANESSRRSAPKQAKKFTKKQIRSPTAQRGQQAMLGVFTADELDEDAHILKCTVEDKSKLEFDCNPKSISQLEKIPFETSETGTIFKDDAGKGANKRSRRSAPKQAKKCTKKQKQSPTPKKGEHAQLGGFAPDELDEDASILKCMPEDKWKLEFDCDPKSISQLEKIPYEISGTRTLFMDDTGKGANKGSRRSAPKQAKKCTKKQKRSPTVKKGEHALLEDVSIWKCIPEDKRKLEFDCDPKSISQLEKIPSETINRGTLFKDDSKDDKISFPRENNAEAQPATKAALPSGKGASKRSRRSAPKRTKGCSKKQKRGPIAQQGEHVMLGGFGEDELDEDAYILKCIVEDKSKLEFDGDSKSISQLEKFPFGTSETESLFKDDNHDDWWRNIPTLDDLLSCGV